MRLSDITVEVRDRTLARVGLIRPEDLDLELNDLHNNVGTWTLRLAVEHPLAARLREPGAGIVVTGPTGVLLSGPTVKPENAASVSDPAGTLTIEGVDDTVLLADTLAYPEPGNGDPVTQKKANDERTGPVESLMHAFVAANIGPGAPAVRRDAGLLAKLRMGTNLARGPVTTKSARFKVLGNLLAELAVVADLGFRIVQRGDALAFETYAVSDRTATIRLDIYNNTLAGHRVALSPPGATQVIVAGQHEGVDRQFLHLTTTDAATAEQVWGRRIERFVDQRNTDNLNELAQAGMEVLAEEGHTTLAVQAVPMEDSAMPFGIGWNVGDRVAVVVEGQELAAIVAGYVLRANASGFRLGALIGDPNGFDPDAALSKRVQSTQNRVSALERAADNAGVRQLNPADFTPTSPTTAYPVGESVLYLSAADVSAKGWSDFAGKRGAIRTLAFANGDASQVWQRHHDNTVTPELWIRGGIAGTPWSSWRRLASITETNTTIAAALKNLEKQYWISIRDHPLGQVEPGWHKFTVTLPEGESFPNRGFTVVGSAHEISGALADAVFITGELIPATDTTFLVRINNTYNRALPCLLDYTAIPIF